MRFIRLISFVCLLFSFTSCSKAKDLLLYKKAHILPYIIVNEQQVTPTAELFQQLFRKATGVMLEIRSHEKPSSQEPNIRISVDQTTSAPFQIFSEGYSLKIQGQNSQELAQAIHSFFNQYVYHQQDSMYILDLPQLDSIILPGDLHINSMEEFAFQYREPYFPLNAVSSFSSLHNTQQLGETWGLWGHNIGKFIQTTPAMYAHVDGQLNADQFNFSSPELEQALKLAIAKSLVDQPSKTFFMIMPNDNDLVCQCDQCRKLGNTKDNASPAIAHLINKLAAAFPDATFFATDYMSSSSAPAISLAENTGVMISSMSFPKGVILKDSKQEEEITTKIKGWKSKTKRIYLWDYAVNFDNYMDAYPTVLLMQENLKFYKDLGVSGVFLQGNDTGYSAFENIKTLLYAQLLKNPDVDIAKLTAHYFQKIAGSNGKVLADYFMEINKRAYLNKYPLDIYGGTKASLRKYLNPGQLQKFYNDLSLAAQHVDPAYQVQFFQLKLSVLFQLLEITRIAGLSSEGYGTYDKQNQLTNINEDTRSRLAILKDLVELADLSTYNEAQASFKDYFEQWKQIILNQSYRNLLYGQTINLLSKTDEEYDDVNQLNDGALGFNDYYNNWMICSQEDLLLEIPMTPPITLTKELQVSFLVDKKHKLQLPELIELWTDQTDKVLEQKISADSSSLIRRTFNLPITLNPTDRTIHIRIKKPKNTGFACDEIILK